MILHTNQMIVKTNENIWLSGGCKIMINLSYHPISMLYPKRGEYKIGVIPPFLAELKAAIIRWDITPSCNYP